MSLIHFNNIIIIKILILPSLFVYIICCSLKLFFVIKKHSFMQNILIAFIIIINLILVLILILLLLLSISTIKIIIIIS